MSVDETAAEIAHRSVVDDYLDTLPWHDETSDYVRTLVAGNVRAYDAHLRPFVHNADIEHRFAFHPATTEEKRAAHGSVRDACKQAALFVDAHVPAGREKALAITKLEEAMFWANAAIARNNNEGTEPK